MLRNLKLKTFYIETYGCQMNEHDSDKMAAMLENVGMLAAEYPESADVVIINTCSIRDKAEHKVYSALGKWKPEKVKRPDLITVVAGCVAQQEKEKLLKKVPHLDLVLGTHQIAELPNLLARATVNRRRDSVTDFSRDVRSLHMDLRRETASVCAFVSIMQGCSNFCSYCVVPYTRGPEQSRSAKEVIDEVKRLVDAGVREVTLLGQNVNAYGKDRGNGNTFPELLHDLNEITGLKRIRFTTSHPKDFDQELVAAMSELRSVCEHIHLPLQSGSNSILRRMKRGYTREEYLAKIAMLRESIPGAAVTADIIVGFPAEAEDDFGQTKSALELIRYDQIFSFKYSARPQTEARNYPDHVSEDVKARRLAEVHVIQESITGAYHDAEVGRVHEVLIEGHRTATNQAFGRTRPNKIVNLICGKLPPIGSLIPVRITTALKHSLLGELAEEIIQP